MIANTTFDVSDYEKREISMRINGALQVWEKIFARSGTTGNWIPFEPDGMSLELHE